jgi:hypothetical protein
MPVTILRSMSRRRVVVGSAVVIGLVLAAGVAAALGGQRDLPTRFTQVDAGTTKVPHMSTADALATFKSRLSIKTLVSVRLGKSPSGDLRQGRWFYATANAPAIRDGLEIESLWQLDLLQGAVAESVGTSTGNLADAIVGSTFDIQLPNGTLVPNVSGGAGDVAAGQVFGTGVPKSDAAVVLRAQSVLKKQGLVPGSVRVLRVGAPAISVTATIPNGRRLSGGLDQLRRAILGEPPVYEGYYFDIRDSLGNPLLKTSAAFRTGAGRLWVKPGLEAAMGVVHG